MNKPSPKKGKVMKKQFLKEPVNISKKFSQVVTKELQIKNNVISIFNFQIDF